MPNLSRILLLALACVLSGCQTASLDDLSPLKSYAATGSDPAILGGAADGQLVAYGRAQFQAGNYVKSYAAFEKATGVFPKEAGAWLGLAASADRIGRFDAADKAYRKLSTLIPERPEYYNNVGYSYLLRGDLQSARRYFLKAYAIDPGNLTVANNLQLLRHGTSLAEQG